MRNTAAYEALCLCRKHYPWRVLKHIMYGEGGKIIRQPLDYAYRKRLKE